MHNIIHAGGKLYFFKFTGVILNSQLPISKDIAMMVFQSCPCANTR